MKGMYGFGEAHKFISSYGPGRGEKMPKNSKNSQNSNSFELLGELDGDETITVNTTSSRGRVLKRTQPFEPDSPPHAKRANSTKAAASKSTPIPSDTDQWIQVKDLLTRVETALEAAERRAEKAEKRIEALEDLIRNELFPRINTPQSTVAQAPPSPPSSPPPTAIPARIPGMGLDLSRTSISEIKEGNAGTVRRRVDEVLKEKGIKCLGVNAKGNGRYRLLFKGKDIDNVRRDDTWLRTHFDRGTLYGEQWYPVRIDRVYHKVAVDELGCTLLGRLTISRFIRCGGLGTCR